MTGANLGELLDALDSNYAAMWHEQTDDERESRCELRDSIRQAIESAFSKLREERDEARKENWDSIDEISKRDTELETLRRFQLYVCQVIAMGNQADLTVESLPR